MSTGRLNAREIEELRQNLRSNPEVWAIPAFERMFTELDLVHRELHEIEVENAELKVHAAQADENGFPVERAINVAEALRLVLEILRDENAIAVGFPQQVFDFANSKLGEYDMKIDTNLPE